MYNFITNVISLLFGSVAKVVIVILAIVIITLLAITGLQKLDNMKLEKTTLEQSIEIYELEKQILIQNSQISKHRQEIISSEKAYNDEITKINIDYDTKIKKALRQPQDQTCETKLADIDSALHSFIIKQE